MCFLEHKIRFTVNTEMKKNLKIRLQVTQFQLKFYIFVHFHQQINDFKWKIIEN